MTRPILNIVITGAGSGLGRGLSAYFAGKGHRLFLTDMNLPSVQQSVSALGTGAQRASAYALDVTSADQIAGFVQSLGDERIDVLVNNAGVQHVSKIEDFPEAKWDLLMDVMVKGPFLMTRALLPRMREAGFGRIINIGSIHSLVASPFKSAYTAAKHAVAGLSKAVALQTADTDITVNTICPAYIRTPLVEGQIKDLARTNGISEEEVVEKIMLRPMPKKRFITFEEVAGTIEFLTTDAARNITGQTIAIDGGWTIE